MYEFIVVFEDGHEMHLFSKDIHQVIHVIETEMENVKSYSMRREEEPPPETWEAA